MVTRTASCACGQLDVDCVGEPQKVSLCHCLDCQRRTGSTYGIAAFFLRDDVTTKGRTNTYQRSSDSGHGVRFHFCPECGSSVYWQPERMPTLIAVAVGSFADPSFPAPTQSVWNERRHPWVPAQD
ncbi:MAG: GFA family protein [Alphaproteobacteria bacterium]|nr:GFA family protein [Alphaproteobacteria bacterium]